MTANTSPDSSALRLPLAESTSSRLAQPRRLFLGSTAAKMLHELPVPMIVVPRERASQEGAAR